MNRSARDHLEDLRRWRGRTPRDGAIGPIVEALRDDAAKTQRRLGLVIDAWERTVPAELARQTRITALSRGTLQVRVASPSVRYELDRFLRSGGEAALRTASRAPLRSIRITVGPVE
jgi:hypothetical protein